VNTLPLASPFIRTFFISPLFVGGLLITALLTFKTQYAYYARDHDLVKNGTQATATVTKNIYHPMRCTRAGCYDWIVYYQFQTPDDKTYQGSAELYLERPVGSHLKIFYRDTQPSDTKPVEYITGLGELLIGPILLILLAAFFAWVGKFSWQQWRRQGAGR